jgi:hypothetical protein
LPGIDQIPEDLMKQKVMHCVLSSTNFSLWNKEEMPEQWKESVIVPIYKKADKISCSKY